MRAIQRTSEIARIKAIPEREPRFDLASWATEQLKTPGGRMSLWGLQSAMLVDLATNKGLLAPVKVSGGKTIVSLLAPVVLNAKRPLLIVPAKHKEKTKRAIRELSQHFIVPNFIRVESYELLGRSQATHLLDNYKPDLIVADECHKLKNKKASVTRKINKYITENKHVIYCGLSGTIARRSLKDYSHQLLWVGRHSNNYPLPFGWSELDDWCHVLDTRPPRDNRQLAPGALLDFCVPEDFDPDPKISARRGYRRRFQNTPGVICSSGKDDIAASLTISDSLVHHDCSKIDEIISNIRTTWTLPDGWALAEAPQVWNAVRQCSLGFYYRFKVEPPREWLLARKTWACFVRENISDVLTSELMVANAYRDSPELHEWQKWRQIFKPEKEGVWFSDAVLQTAATWLESSRHQEMHRLCWVDYIEFGEALSRLTGIPYFREQAKCGNKHIMDHVGPAIVSQNSIGEGFDLQYTFAENLIVSPFGSSAMKEQILGRTHRYVNQQSPYYRGVEADEVTCELLVNCLEHATAIQDCIEEAKGIKDREGLENKLLFCDIVLEHTPEKLVHLKGGRWNK